jgi:hypothetical protein
MLTQQVARYLLKTARELKEKGHVPCSSKNPTIEYLKGFLLLFNWLNRQRICKIRRQSAPFVGTVTSATTS